MPKIQLNPLYQVFICASVVASLFACTSQSTRTIAADQTATAASPREGLWTAVRAECLDQTIPPANPPDCILTDKNAGYVVFKDRKSPTHFLVIPTTKITGIEDPQLLSDQAPNFFAAAWASRHLVSERAGKDLPDEAVGLALNPVFARSQDQLHVHMDCVKEDVMKLLADHQDEMASTWGHSTISFEGFDFRVLFRQGDDLKNMNPIQLLKTDLGSQVNLIGQHTLIVIGGRSADGKNGFYILDGTSDPNASKKIHGEDWLDLTCSIAKK